MARTAATPSEATPNETVRNEVTLNEVTPSEVTPNEAIQIEAPTAALNAVRNAAAPIAVAPSAQIWVPNASPPVRLAVCQTSVRHEAPSEVVRSLVARVQPAAGEVRCAAQLGCYFQCVPCDP